MFIEIENKKRININDIPTIDINDLRREIISLNKRVIAFFGKKEYENTRLFVVLADDENSKLYVSSSIFEAWQKEYDSLTQVLPAFHMFEREFYEDFDIKPLNHPWLKPIKNHKNNYDFFEMTGDEVHQVAVGPIHAGVIEPGHFRFMCHGEKIYDLEIQLGYQHRGVEELFLKTPSNQLAESICGDSVIAHNLAYSNTIEALSDCEISNKAQLIRLIALEMERCAIHIGDLGAISGDIAYMMGAAVFGATRTLVINTMLELSGSRFGRGLITLGGVNFDIDEELKNKIISVLEKVAIDVERTTKTMLKSPTVASRLERTGIVSEENAKSLGLTGMAARASGVNIDTRFDFPDKWYKNVENRCIKADGDVYSRTRLRYKEIKQSIYIIKKFLKELENYKDEPLVVDVPPLKNDSFVVSLVEGWRGEVVHIGLTDNNAHLLRYKIKDPSFNNWFALAMAVRNNGISDFPLCNKSFNLSYCGNDL
jgi:Ni,Fe-hydrogenase III large subunit